MVTRKGPISRFIKVKCSKCKNEQIIFNKASTAIKCLVCEEILATPRGGKAKVSAQLIEDLG